MKRTIRVSIGLLLVATVGFSSAAVAREKDTFAVGYAKCETWCDNHNKTSKSINQCKDTCYVYWDKNAADAN